MTRAAYAAVTLALVLVPATTVASAAGQPRRPPTGAVAHLAAVRPAGEYADGYAANRAAARREARHLLALAELPGAKVALPHPPRGLRTSASAPSGASVDLARYYRVRLTFRAAAHWLRRHRPEGLTDGGSGSWGRARPGSHHVSRVIGRDVDYDAHDTRSYVQAVLQVEYVRGRRGATLWRLDGTAQPLDPRPLRDRTHGPTARITTTSGCRPGDRRWVDVRNRGARLDHRMLPPGRPDAVLICAYAGFDGHHPMTLRAHRRFGAHVARSLARAALAVSLGHVDGAVYSCPMGRGGRLVVAFGYPRHRGVTLVVNDEGCLSMDNGHILSGAWPFHFAHSVTRALRGR